MNSKGKKILNAVKFATCLALGACVTFSQNVKATETVDVTGGSFLTAAETTVNNTCIVNDTGNGGEYFKFVPAATGKFTFQSSLYSSGDPKVKVYDSNQKQLGYNDDGGEQNNFKLEVSLEAGKTYYIYAYGVNGNGYQMTISYKDWTLSDASVNIEAGKSTFSIYAVDCEVASAVSSDNNIVTAAVGKSRYGESEIILTKNGEGTATVTVTATNGTQKTCTVNCSYAPFTLSKNTVVFDKKLSYNSYYIYTSNGDSKIVSGTSSNSKVATAKMSYSEVCITPVKAGKTTITVTDDKGRTANVSVVVKKSWAKANLKSSTYASLAYGSKKMCVGSKPGAKVTVKVGGKTYSAKIGKKGYKYIKVKSLHKYKAKMKVTVKYKKLKTSFTNKVHSNTYAYMQTIWSCKYTIPVKAYHITKGDVLMITVGGKTYKKKFKKNADAIEHVFTTKYRNRNYSTIRIRVKNKFGQKIYDNTRSITWR